MFFESNYHPFSTSDLAGQKVLVLSPHPDDESLACGGSLALHTANGDPVKVIFLTDGAQGDVNAEYSPEDYVALRETEAREAGTILGVTDIEFWHAPDRGLAQAETVLPRLCKLLQEYQPQLVYAPSPLEFHPDHEAAARLLWLAIQQTAHQCNVAYYDYNRPININVLVDISSVVERKRQACDRYQSQLKHYPYTDCAISFNRYRSLTVSSRCQYAEGFFILDSREIWAQPIESFAVKQFLPWRKKENCALVSVIVRTHNRPQLLREAIASVLGQTYKNIELVVVNDGGEDVQNVITEFNGYLPINHVRHAKSRGRAAAANAGMQVAKGKYINFLDDDDVLYADHVDKVATYLETTGEHFAYSDCELRDYTWTGDALIPRGDKQLFYGVDFDREKLDTANYIATMCGMFRKELFDRSGPFDESLEWLEDWDMWIRMSRLVNFHHLPGASAEYRRLSRPQYGSSVWTKHIYEKHGSNAKPSELAMRRTASSMPSGSLETIYRLPELPTLSSQFADLPILCGHLDQVTPVASGRVHITGWVLSLNAPTREIEVHYGGKQLQKQALSERSDVGKYAPWISQATQSGFGFNLDVGNLELSGGAGMLEIVGISADGRRTGVMSHLLRDDLDRFPSPPEEYMYRVAHTRDAHFYKLAAIRTFGEIVQLLNRHVDWDNIETTLDWGCGSGRLSAQFLSAAPSIGLTGADIDVDAIEWCRSNFTEGRFHVLAPLPPTPYDDCEFGLIVAHSVLTHLQRDVQEAWLQEMHRVLKPGGWFVATTHGDFAFQFATQSLEPKWPPGEFYDVADPTFDKIAPTGYYRGTYQSEKYTRQEFGKLFEIVEYIPRGACGIQDLILMRKAPGAGGLQG
jgi:LmbE family N-acetylglucosaminyl deacetylase/SAM-dependent methyltransferase